MAYNTYQGNQGNQGDTSEGGLRESRVITINRVAKVVRGGRRLCTTGATRSVAFRWGSDLGAQSMSQSSCPDGTIATMAIGHTDVVRCVPL